MEGISRASVPEIEVLLSCVTHRNQCFSPNLQGRNSPKRLFGNVLCCCTPGCQLNTVQAEKGCSFEGGDFHAMNSGTIQTCL